ncbi:FKBP-type peptidyl-prolyl cis-trans isomerase [Parahaliea mediterranea]|uniref:Peptidyl-prolyl cis-trans isomerase n=1 Tax=Parahaliea mediterranea TaxID=651086 RepID=A0A939DFR8_9GAMM|nr:peptidylprolyl isomerase [Parahaliea mediterranea]MBN7796717.1 peptidylprolyl isomerase [Parahaliea mediterranea]
MSLLIGDNAVVSLHYKLSDAEGNEIENSAGAEPLKYLHGAGNLIPGLENALVGKSTGAELTVAVPPEDAYGEVVPQLIQEVDREVFQGVDSIEPGMAFQAQGQDGGAQRVVVTAVDGDKVTIDANHPLAGVELHFDVQVVDVRPATDEEVDHGHPH